MKMCCLAKSVSGLGAKGLEDHGQRAEFGKRGLEQIESYKGGQPQPVHGVKLGQGQARQDYQAGKGKYDTVNAHSCFPRKITCKYRQLRSPAVNLKRILANTYIDVYT